MLELPWKPGETRGCWEFPLVQMSPPTLHPSYQHHPPVSTPPRDSHTCSSKFI